jgi:hypothetical protein
VSRWFGKAYRLPKVTTEYGGIRMSARTEDGGDRFPTTGPDAPPVDGIELVATEGGAVLVYDPADAERWIETDAVCTLDEWR